LVRGCVCCISTNYYLVLPSAFSAPGTAPAKSSSYSNDITNYRVTIQSETNNSLENIDTSISSLQTNLEDLESKIVFSGQNTAIGYNVLTQVTTGTDNTAVGYGATTPPYGITTGSYNTMLGTYSGNSCETGSNNTFLGYNTAFKPGQTAYNGSIALGSNATINNSDQLMVASNVTSFNITGLAASTGTGAGTILEFDSAGNVLPTAGTYKTVASIDTAIAAVNAPYAMSWAANSEYTYTGSSQALAIWDTISFGNSANMASKTTWTCPAAGLWHIAATFGFSISTNDVSCSFRLYQNGSEVWYFTAWYNIAGAGQGITTQCESIFLNLATGDTLEWYLDFSTSMTVTIGGGNQNSGNTTFNAIRIAPGYTAA